MDLRELAKVAAGKILRRDNDVRSDVFSQEHFDLIEKDILHALETAVGEKDETIEAGCLAVQQQQELINEQINQLADLRAKLESSMADTAQARYAHESARDEIVRLKLELEIDNKGNQEWIDDLSKQLCKMEDALGFKHDQYDKGGKWVPTIEPWLERVRDLIAAEWEVGDLKLELEQARKDGALRDALGWLLTFVGQGEEQKFAEWVYQNTPAKSTTSVAELEKLIHECLSKCWTALANPTRQAEQEKP